MNAKIALTTLTIGLSIAPATAFARHHNSYPMYAFGTVSMHNDTPATLTVTIGNQVRTLPPQMTTTVNVPVGSTRMVATYVLYGQVRSLPRQELYVEPGRFRWIELDAPSQAVVRVTNEYDQPGVLFSDGVYIDSIAPFATEYVSLPVGTHDLNLVVDRRTVERERVTARAMMENRFVAEAPRFADVHIQNPLPIAVVLGTDRGLVKTIPAYGVACFDDLAVGSLRLTARRVSGELIDDTTLAVRAFDDNRWVVDAPRTGLVSMDNDTRDNLTVLDNGRVIATLAPGQESRVSLSLGAHELSIRDCHGREIEERWVQVDPFAMARFDIDERRHERAYAQVQDDGRDGRDERDDRDEGDHRGHRSAECADGHC